MSPSPFHAAYIVPTLIPVIFATVFCSCSYACCSRHGTRVSPPEPSLAQNASHSDSRESVHQHDILPSEIILFPSYFFLLFKVLFLCLFDCYCTSEKTAEGRKYISLLVWCSFCMKRHLTHDVMTLFHSKTKNISNDMIVITRKVQEDVGMKRKDI